MKPDQLTLRELLRDPTYRRWFAKTPVLTVPQKTPGQKSWWLYVMPQEGDRWQRGELASYNSAYEHVRKKLQHTYDLTIHSKRRSYGPPRGYVWPISHDWCAYCRRPTVFWYFRKHHALKQFSWMDLSDERRCSICGIRLSDQMVWKWNHA